MSIEDINYLKKNSIKQSYTFLIDSKNRDRNIYPTPSEYVVDFTVPFRNVIGLEVLDVSVPKTMYNIDKNNNRIYYYISDSTESSNVTILTDENGNEYYDPEMFSYVDFPPGDYTTNTLIDKVRFTLFNNNIDLDMNSVDSPAELTNLIYFTSSKPFILDMHRSSMAEVLGFDLYTNTDSINATKYKYNHLYNHKEGFQSIFHSIINSNGNNYLQAPGMMYLIGFKYVILKCPEIEQHLYRSLSYSKYSLGLAKIRVNSYGYNDEKTSFLKVPLREFHPIGKLTRISLRFETNDGQLYDFKGVNHNIVFGIYYYEPKQENEVRSSILNPEYNPNLMNYLYTQEEQEGESDDDDDDDYSRDNINIFKTREKEYSSSGMANENRLLAFKEKQKNDLRKSEYENLVKKVKKAQNITLLRSNEPQRETDQSDQSEESEQSDQSEESDQSEQSDDSEQ